MGAGQARRAEHLDRAGEGFLLRLTLLSPPRPGNSMMQSGRGGVAFSRAPCWLTAGTQGMRLSEQEGFKAAVPEPGLAPVLTRFGAEKGGP